MAQKSSDPMHGLISNAQQDETPGDIVNYAQDPSNANKGIGNKAVDGASNLGGKMLNGLRSLGSMFAGPAAAIGGAATAVSGAIARTFNVSSKTASVMSLVLAVSLLGSGGVAVAALTAPDVMNTVYVGNVDCEKAVKAAKTKFGFGERQIPEEVGGMPCGYVTTWEGSWAGLSRALNLVPPLSTVRDFCFDTSTGQHRSENGAYQDDKGFERIDDYYLVAVGVTPFGVTEDVDATTGDWITFYLSDGTPIECIVVDTKGDSSGPGYNFRDGTTSWDEIVPISTPTGPAAICAWGHTYGEWVNVLEFVGIADVNDQFERITGKKGLRVESFDTHGTAPELEHLFGNEGGAAGAASSNQSKARSKGLDRAANECRRFCPKSYDNSSAAMAALSVAYSRDISYDGSSGEGTKVFQEVWAKVDPGDWIMRSCDRCVCVFVRWSGTDDDYPNGDTGQQNAYVIASDKWEEIPYERSMIDADGNSTVLQPGDIWVESGHTSMYVGNELIKNFEFTGDANVGPVAPGAFSVSGSIGSYSDMGGIGSKAPGVGFDDGLAGTPRVFRCVNPTGADKSKWADGSIDGGSVAASTGCEDTVKKTKKKNSFSDTDFSDMLIIGDSLLANDAVQSELKKMLPGATIDAVGGRAVDRGTMDDNEADGAVSVARAKASGFDRIVYEIGTNGSGKSGALNNSEVKEMVTAAGDAEVWFVTVNLVNRSEHTDKVNAAIRWAAENFDNVNVIDWHSTAALHPEYHTSDGIHLTSDGSSKFATAIASGVGAHVNAG